MALKALMLKKKLSDASKALEALRALDGDFEKREQDLAASIEEAETEEERAAVEEAIGAFESDKAQHEEKRTELEKTVEDLEKELEDEERAQDTEPEEEPEERKETKPMVTRDRIFGKMTIQERSAFCEREDVKAYLEEVRACMKEKRALQNVGVTIPEVMLGLLKENVMDYSKLYKHVTVRAIGGNGRAVVMGAIPEAIWTDCCANINELDLAFADLELECWKVGGYFAVCNASLEDSDIDLAAELLTTLGQAIGRALDKAILYGTGNRMPQGVVTRLAQTSQPGDYPATARPWEDLHTSNILTAASSGIDLYRNVIVNLGAAKGKYSRGELVHVMNEKTYTYLIAQGLSVNAAGAIVTGVNGVLPVAGGVIEVINDVPDYNIISGYFDLYYLAERAGQKFATSEHYKFLADQTVFKGTARYDGKPAIAEAFVAQAVNGASVSTSTTFAPDAANGVSSIRLNADSVSVAVSGTVTLTAVTEPGAGTVTWASANTSKATVDGGVVTGVGSGNTTITATCNGLTASCAVTVTAS